MKEDAADGASRTRTGPPLEDSYQFELAGPRGQWASALNSLASGPGLAG
jgi:hypothetical protein